MTEHDRRASDPIILEMHGMLCTLTETMKNHVKVDEDFHAEQTAITKDHEVRLKPIEGFHDTAKTLSKWGALIAAPSVTGIGYGLWLWIKGLVANGKMTQ